MRLILMALILGCIILGGCASQKQTDPTAELATGQNITTNQTKTMAKKLLQFQVTGYSDKGRMPAKYATKAGGGENVSIGLKWQSLPAAQSYALLFDDKHPIANNWVHWLVVDIPNTATEIAEGASRTDMPEGSRELRTSWGRTGYDGPQPPVGSGDHEYAATLYALDIPKSSLAEDTTREEFLNAIEGHVIAKENWNGYFSR